MLIQGYRLRQPAEIPNPKFQIPNKFQFQKTQEPKRIAIAHTLTRGGEARIDPLDFGCLRFPGALGFGVWDFRRCGRASQLRPSSEGLIQCQLIRGFQSPSGRQAMRDPRENKGERL